MFSKTASISILLYIICRCSISTSISIADIIVYRSQSIHTHAMSFKANVHVTFMHKPLFLHPHNETPISSLLLLLLLIFMIVIIIIIIYLFYIIFFLVNDRRFDQQLPLFLYASICLFFSSSENSKHLCSLFTSQHQLLVKAC